MKFIDKNRNTQGYQRLVDLKRIGGTYEDVKNDVSKSDFIRDEVLTSLLEEQGYICAYCMRKISLSNATIEHIVGQKYVENGINMGSENQINYDNLLAVCEGKSCKDNFHCDKSRAKYQKERQLYANPLINRIIQNIKFAPNGLIYYKDFIKIEEVEELKEHHTLCEESNIRYDIHKVLNLNCQNLKGKREAIIKALKKLTKNWTNQSKIQTELQKYKNKQSDGFAEFCQVAIYVLNKKVER